MSYKCYHVCLRQHVNAESLFSTSEEASCFFIYLSVLHFALYESCLCVDQDTSYCIFEMDSDG